MKGLTRDNPHYQALKLPQFATAPYLQSIAHKNLVEGLSNEIREFTVQSLGAGTRRAYAGDLRKFERWGGHLPCEPEILAAYFVDHARTHLPATLTRWAASISRAHTARGFPDPTKVEPVVSTLKGIRRSLGRAPNGANPLLRGTLFAALDAMGSSIIDKRDRALLLIGFGGGFRRSELVGLDVADVNIVRRGLLITIRRSKTDQEGNGRQLAIPFGNTRHCPVMAFENWLKMLEAPHGPLFRPVNRHDQVSNLRLSGEAVSDIVKRRVSRLGIDSTPYSGHSLRAGFATSAAEMGVSSWKIRQQTGHKSDQMLARYVRTVELFEGNAAGAVL